MKTLKINLSYFFKKFWPILLIVFLVLIFFWKVFLLGQTPFPGDFVVGIYYPWLDYKWGYLVGVPVKNPIVADVPSFMYPMQTFAASLLKIGKLPLWNPYILAGTPLLANFQSAPLSPLNIFYFFTSYINAWSVKIITSHLLAAYFTFLLLRNWKLSRISAVLGGLIFSFSGFNLIWSQWNGHVLTSAFFPLIILFVELLLTSRKHRVVAGVALSVVLAFQIFSGYPQLILYTAAVVGVQCLIHICWKKEYFISIIYLGFFLSLGFGLSAIQLFPSAELLSLSQWSAEPHPRLWAFLPIEKMITFLAPDYFGNHVTSNYWGPQDYTSNTGFVGVSVAILAVLGFTFFRERKGLKLAFLITLLSLFLSYNTPISEFLWANNIFGMGSSSAHRALVLFNLGLAVGASFGFEYLRESKFSKRILFFSFLPSALILTIFTLLAKRDFKIVALRNLILPFFVFVLIFALFLLVKRFFRFKKQISILIFAITIFEIYRFGWKFTPFSTPDLVFPDTPITQFLKSQEKPFRISNGNTMPVNFQMAYGFETLGGYETMRPFLSSQFIASLNNDNPNANPSGRYGIIDNDTSRLLDLANTKYYLTLKTEKSGTPNPNGQIPIKFDRKRYKAVFEDKTTVILESKSVLPRAFMVYDWEVIEDGSSTLGRLLDPKFLLNEKIVLAEKPIFTEFSIKKGTSKVNYTKYLPQESLLSVQTDRDGMLFVSDSFYPGWKAYVDRKETKIYRADFAFRAVAVSKGIHEISFIYIPESFSRGVKVSFFSLSLLILLSICRWRYNKIGK